MKHLIILSLIPICFTSGRAHADSFWFGDSVLNECFGIDSEKYKNLELCAESLPSGDGRKFIISVKDGSNLAGKQEVELEPGEYMDYRNVNEFELGSLYVIWVPVVKGVPDDYDAGYTLLYTYHPDERKFRRLETRLVCRSKCTSQFLSYQSGGGKTTLIYDYTVNGQSLRSTYSWDGLRIKPLQIEEARSREALTGGRQAPSSTPVCERTPQVVVEIERRLNKKKCEKITLEDLDKITFLALGNKNVEKLKPGDFSGMRNLNSIELSSNPLKSIQKGLFDGLFVLRSLTFQKCQLTTIPGGVFSDLGSLKDLYLNHNRITHLPEDAFEGLKSLTFLALNHNKIQSLPEGIFAPCKALKRAYMSGNPLRKKK